MALGPGGGNFGAVFLLASAEPYARGGKAMINKSLTYGNARPYPNGRIRVRSSEQERSR